MAVENIVLITIITIIIISIEARHLESKVVQGELANITDYPHSAYLSIECETYQRSSFFGCGSSIINQVIVLTAGHCLEDCLQSSFITVSVGYEGKSEGRTVSASSFKIHEKFDTEEISNDIALVRLKKSLKLGKTVRRVVLMPSPPYHHPASVAGWGYINEEKRIGTNELMHTTQTVWSRASCITVFGQIPKGTFCAGDRKAKNYVSNGDSGSALMVRKFIQIGIVSYKVPGRSRSLAVYTDVGHFYYWIQDNIKELYCNF